MKKPTVFFSTFLLVISAYSSQKIFQIKIAGNKIVSDATIFSILKTRRGEVYNESVIDNDIKNLYETGYFDDIRVEKMATGEGIIVIFKFKERAVIKEIDVKGTHRIHKKRIEKLIDLEEGSFLDEYRLEEIKNKIKDLYNKRGFSEAEVSYNIELDDEKRYAKITFNINEGRVVRVKRIVFKGNVHIKTKRLQKLMRTKAKWLFNKGLLKEEILIDDIKRIEDFYKEEGFSEVKVDYAIERIVNEAYITININEGKRYYVGTIRIEGNEVLPLDAIKKVIGFKEGDIYIERKVREGSNNIRGLYIDGGYIYVEVKPTMFLNLQTNKVDVSFNITENEVAYVEKIEIRGNTKTRDKVIRRELRIYPGDKFEGEKIRKSRQRLENLGFFEEIRFNSEPGSRPQWENLIINVKEAKTGYLSFGGGYSSIDQFTGFIELRQRNFDYKNWSTFTGGGQDLSIRASFGSIADRYELDFTNPWIFDKPISFGFQGYKRGHQQDEDVGYGYEEDVAGGAVMFAREFSDYLKGRVGYRFESVEITDVVSDASQALKEEAGTHSLSTIELGLTYDTRDNIFSPTTGIYFSNSLDITASFLGGKKDFIRFSSIASKFFSLSQKAVIEFKLRLGIAEAFSNTDKVPIYKRFFAGGSSTIRGYHERKIGPIDSLTEDPIGGEALFIGNIEYTYLLTDIIKLAVFFDTGNVWERRSDLLSGGFKSSIGIGIRLKTPLGPISLDYGWPLNTEPGEEGKEGRFHFNISRGF